MMQNSTDRAKLRPSPKRSQTPPQLAGEMLAVLSHVMSVENLDAVLQKIASTVADLFAIRGLFLSVLDDKDQVFRIHASIGYDEATQQKIRKTVYSQERLKKDLENRWKVADNVYFIRPSPEDFVKIDEPFYFHVQDITKPRTDPNEWHELDYLKLAFTDRDGAIRGYIEIVEPMSKRVFDKATIESMEIFAQLAGVAIENAKLYQKQVEIAQRRRYLSDMIAHDISNYNQAVTSYLQMASSEPKLPPKVGNYLQRASSSAWGISELIQRANKLAKIEEEGAANLGPVELGEVLKESTSEVLRNHPERDVKIDLKLGNHRYFVTGNELATDIFKNILNNAVEYDPHEKVSVEVSIGEFFVDFRRYWCVSVADNGIGIPSSKKNIVFGRFSPDIEAPPASGLGLSIVRAIVEAYHGMIWVEDRVPDQHSKGSVFRVALPMASAK
jgi:signal transduction histidine kinase